MSNLTSLKPITLRLPEGDLSYVKQEAESLGISTGVYLRILVKQSLAAKQHTSTLHQANALRSMSDILAPVASAKGLSETDILQMTKTARKEIAQKSKINKNS